MPIPYPSIDPTQLQSLQFQGQLTSAPSIPINPPSTNNGLFGMVTTGTVNIK